MTFSRTVSDQHVVYLRDGENLVFGFGVTKSGEKSGVNQIKPANLVGKLSLQFV